MLRCWCRCDRTKNVFVITYVNRLIIFWERVQLVWVSLKTLAPTSRFGPRLSINRRMYPLRVQKKNKKGFPAYTSIDLLGFLGGACRAIAQVRQ